jgi:H+/gluconate symporter-like permease
MLEPIQNAIEGLRVTPLAVLDVLLLAFIIHQLLKLIRGTRSVNMMIALGVLVLLHVVPGRPASTRSTRCWAWC